MLHKEDNTPIASYYPSKTHQPSFKITVFSMLIYMFAFVAGIVWFWVCLSVAHTKEIETEAKDSQNIFKKILLYIVVVALFWYYCKPCQKLKKIIYELCFFMGFFFVGSTILSLSFHFPHILMAWITDPFYASKIGVFYGIIIFCYFIAFHYVYAIIVSAQKEAQTNRKNTSSQEQTPSSENKNEENSPSPEQPVDASKKNDDTATAHGTPENDKKGHESCCKKCCVSKTCCRVFFPISMILIPFFLITGLIVTVAIFITSIPVNNSIETSTDAVTSIYNGAVVLIGGLLAYRLGWRYIGRPFSVKDALEKALEQVKETKKKNQKWDDLDNEGRLTALMTKYFQEKVLNETV